MNVVCAMCLRLVAEDPTDPDPDWYTHGCEMCYS